MHELWLRVCYFCHAPMLERMMTSTDEADDYAVPTHHCPNGHGQVYVIEKQSATNRVPLPQEETVRC